MIKRAGYVCTGLAYGTALMFLSFCAAGFGHGSYVLLGLTSSPLGAWPFKGSVIAVALLGTPVLWGLVGLLVALLPDRRARGILVLVMGGHYVTAFFLLWADPFGDWYYLPKMLGVFASGAAVYCLGQIALWTAFVRSKHVCKGDRQSEPLPFRRGE